MEKITLNEKEYLIIETETDYRKIEQYDEERKFEEYQLEGNEVFMVIAEDEYLKGMKIITIEINAIFH